MSSVSYRKMAENLVGPNTRPPSEFDPDFHEAKIKWVEANLKAAANSKLDEVIKRLTHMEEINYFLVQQMLEDSRP